MKKTELRKLIKTYRTETNVIKYDEYEVKIKTIIPLSDAIEIADIVFTNSINNGEYDYITSEYVLAYMLIDKFTDLPIPTTNHQVTGESVIDIEACYVLLHGNPALKNILFEAPQIKTIMAQIEQRAKNYVYKSNNVAEKIYNKASDLITEAFSYLDSLSDTDENVTSLIFKKLLKEDPKNFEALVNIIEAFKDLGKPSKAGGEKALTSPTPNTPPTNIDKKKEK